MKKGYMIAFDGGNGAGKSTLIKNLKTHLVEQGYDVEITREPGGTPIGERIRYIVLSPETPEMNEITEVMLFAAARAQHVREKIIPAIEAGKIVLCDRFTAASVSFQHYGRGIDLTLVEKLNQIALGSFSPDLYIILDIDPVIGAQRLKLRGEALDRVELTSDSFHSKARMGFLAQAKENSDLFRVVDASRSSDEVFCEVAELVKSQLST